MNTVTINPALIKAIMPFVSADDIRYYLKGICIEYSPTATRYIATDGHILGMAQEDETNDGAGTLIIPLDTCKRIAAIKTKLHIQLTQQSETLWTCAAFPELAFKPIDGRFPGYMHIVRPAWEAQEEFPAYFNPAILYKIHQCGKAQGMKTPNISMRYGAKGSPACFACGNIYGVVMPWRSDEPSIPFELLAPLSAPAPTAIAA